MLVDSYTDPGNAKVIGRDLQSYLPFHPKFYGTVFTCCTATTFTHILPAVDCPSQTCQPGQDQHRLSAMLQQPLQQTNRRRFHQITLLQHALARKDERKNMNFGALACPFLAATLDNRFDVFLPLLLLLLLFLFSSFFFLLFFLLQFCSCVIFSFFSFLAISRFLYSG